MATTQASAEEAAIGRDIAATPDMSVTAGGDFATVAGVANLQLSLARRVLTTPGAIMHRPNYGGGLSKYLHKPVTPALLSEIRISVLNQFKLERRVAKVVSVSPSISPLGVLTVDYIVEATGKRIAGSLSVAP